jgi:hypothetical protein
MKIIKCICIILFICSISYSCNENKINNQSKLTIQDEELNIRNDQEQKIDTLLLYLFNNLNFFEIKQKYGGTTGVLSDKEIDFFFITDSVSQGVFGIYFLIDNKDPNIDVFATSKIYTPKKDWFASDKDEKLLELTIYKSSNIKISKEIFVGNSKNTVINLLGQPQKILENMMFYYDDNGIILSLYMQNDTINKIKIGQYKIINDEILHDILNDLQCKWC